MASDLFKSWSHFIFGCRVQYLSFFLRIWALKLFDGQATDIDIDPQYQKIYMEILVFPGFFSIIKGEKILKGSLDSISSPSPSLKIQIMEGKVCLTCKGKTLLGIHGAGKTAKQIQKLP